MGISGCDPKMQEELKPHFSLCPGNIQIVQVLIFPNFLSPTPNFCSAANSPIALQQLNVKMVFLAKNALKRKKKIRHSHPSKKSIMFTNLAQHCGPHSQWSHMGMLLYNLIYVAEASCKQGQCSRRHSGVFGFKQHKENL